MCYNVIMSDNQYLLKLPNDKEGIITVCFLAIDKIKAWMTVNSVAIDQNVKLPFNVFLINYDLLDNFSLAYELLQYAGENLITDDKQYNLSDFDTFDFGTKVKILTLVLSDFAMQVENTELPAIYQKLDLPDINKLQELFKSDKDVTCMQDVFTS